MIKTINNINIIYANTFYKRFKGLMLKKEIKKGMIFKTKSIHTFFMKSNIDILILDKKFKIIEILTNIPKNKIIIKKKAYYIVELPINNINNLKPNDILS